jgi:hypothetical protein
MSLCTKVWLEAVRDLEVLAVQRVCEISIVDSFGIERDGRTNRME